MNVCVLRGRSGVLRIFRVCKKKCFVSADRYVSVERPATRTANFAVRMLAASTQHLQPRFFTLFNCIIVNACFLLCVFVSDKIYGARRFALFVFCLSGCCVLGFYMRSATLAGISWILVL